LNEVARAMPACKDRKREAMTKLEAAQEELEHAQEALNAATEQYRRAIVRLMDALDESFQVAPPRAGQERLASATIEQYRRTVAKLLTALANSARYVVHIGPPASALPTSIGIPEEERAALVRSLRGRYADRHNTVDEFLRQKHEDAARENSVTGGASQ
jgi:exonuclease VII small subunit